MAKRSHPSRGAWIEITRRRTARAIAGCRTPHGVRGLKSSMTSRSAVAMCRTPHGVRGLKYLRQPGSNTAHSVAPLTGCVD